MSTTFLRTHAGRCNCPYCDTLVQYDLPSDPVRPAQSQPSLSMPAYPVTPIAASAANSNAATALAPPPPAPSMMMMIEAQPQHTPLDPSAQPPAYSSPQPAIAATLPATVTMAAVAPPYSPPPAFSPQSTMTLSQQPSSQPILQRPHSSSLSPGGPMIEVEA